MWPISGTGSSSRLLGLAVVRTRGRRSVAKGGDHHRHVAAAGFCEVVTAAAYHTCYEDCSSRSITQKDTRRTPRGCVCDACVHNTSAKGAIPLRVRDRYALCDRMEAVVVLAQPVGVAMVPRARKMHSRGEHTSTKSVGWRTVVPAYGDLKPRTKGTMAAGQTPHRRRARWACLPAGCGLAGAAPATVRGSVRGKPAHTLKGDSSANCLTRF